MQRDSLRVRSLARISLQKDARDEQRYGMPKYAAIPNGLSTRILADSIPWLGAEVAGLITVDMTFLKREGHIQPKPPSDFSQHGDPKKLHWDVEFDLVMIVDGRNLYYEARWPPSNPEEIPVQQVVMGRGQTCIAAAFEPGTA